MPTAALYSRVSTESEEQLQALEQQQARLREAVPEGYEALEFTDILSGTSTDRPEFDRLMQSVTTRAVDLVISTRLDRMSRNRFHGGQILDEFSVEGAPRLLLLDDQLDLGTVGGRLMAGILVSWSIAESERLGERAAHGHAHRRKLRKPFGPSAPRGYEWNEARDNYQLAADADQYRDLIRRFQKDPEIRKWMRWANEHGMPFGSPSAFSRWMCNPSLAGARVYGVSKKVRIPDERLPGRTKTIRRHNKPGEYGEIHWDAHPELISRETHAWLVAHFETRRLQKDTLQATAPLKEGRTRVVTGFGQCASCGKRMCVHQSSRQAQPYYRCNRQQCDQRYRNRIPESKIIEAASAHLRTMAAAMAERADRAFDGDRESPEVAKLRGEIADAKQLNNPRMAPVIEAMERELEVTLKRAELAGGGSVSAKAALEAILQMPDFFEDMEPEGQRAVFLECIEAVVIDKGQVMEVKGKAII
ncbi:MAG: Transposon Tn3 resolvase [Synechococcus sp. MIT S9220]|nr:MAG: Transposon Tn3 resolvase [Synechococcus sp. MIT S9220]